MLYRDSGETMVIDGQFDMPPVEPGNITTIAKTPPALLSWGDNDFPHLIPQAEKMADALRAAGGDVATLTLEGCDHLGASYDCGKADGQWLPFALEWMAAH